MGESNYHTDCPFNSDNTAQQLRATDGTGRTKGLNEELPGRGCVGFPQVLGSMLPFRQNLPLLCMIFRVFWRLNAMLLGLYYKIMPERECCFSVLL